MENDAPGLSPSAAVSPSGSAVAGCATPFGLQDWLIEAVLSVPPAVYGTIQRDGTLETIRDAVADCVPHGVAVQRFGSEVRLLPSEPHWQDTVMDVLRGKGINNQGAEKGTLRAPHLFEGLRYRSPAEMAIAQALEVTDAAYWPNCLARLGLDAPSRTTREADFLIHRRGKWGILKVDDPNYHGGMAARDHAGDRVFLQHGSVLIQRFAARDCLSKPAEVVSEFFRLLADLR